MLLAPGVVLLAVIVVTTLPAWALLALAASPLVPGRLRPLRLLWIGTVYLVWDAAALLALFVLWLASGFGAHKRSPAFQRAHYVLCRHAGPGDSFILIHALVNWFHREPRIVLKETLQWDPAIDVLLNRLPNRFIAPGPDGRESAIRQVGHLATGLDDDDAFVIFPEGGNFTPKRRLRAIARLRTLGLERMALRAERMRHVLAPQPGGLLAALDAAPDAGVIFVAHTGLDQMVTVADVWRELPMDKRIVMRFWSVPPEEVPVGRQERIDWLFDWWARIDRWIAANRDGATAD
jgi:1-acyl-sn-glycerol-3-phosphate acyltransferase